MKTLNNLQRIREFGYTSIILDKRIYSTENDCTNISSPVESDARPDKATTASFHSYDESFEMPYFVASQVANKGVYLSTRKFHFQKTTADSWSLEFYDTVASLLNTGSSIEKFFKSQLVSYGYSRECKTSMNDALETIYKNDEIVIFKRFIKNFEAILGILGMNKEEFSTNFHTTHFFNTEFFQMLFGECPNLIKFISSMVKNNQSLTSFINKNNNSSSHYSSNKERYVCYEKITNGFDLSVASFEELSQIIYISPSIVHAVTQKEKISEDIWGGLIIEAQENQNQFAAFDKLSLDLQGNIIATLKAGTISPSTLAKFSWIVHLNKLGTNEEFVSKYFRQNCVRDSDQLVSRLEDIIENLKSEYPHEFSLSPFSRTEMAKDNINNLARQDMFGRKEHVDKFVESFFDSPIDAIAEFAAIPKKRN